MPRRLSTPRLIIAALGLAIFAYGIHWVVKGVAWERRFEAWLTEEPVRIRIDPTTAAVYSAPFHQTCSIAHAQRLYLEPVSHVDPAAFIAAADSLRVSLSLQDADNNTTEVLLLGPLFADEQAAEVMIDRLLPPRDAHYTLTLTVHPSTHPDMPTAAEVVLRNELCGMELFPAYGYQLAGIVAILVGFITTLAAQPWRRPRQRTAPSA